MLKNKVALVTGSTSGIGLGVARSFAQAGASLVLNGLGNSDDIAQLTNFMTREFGVKVVFNPANMTKPLEISKMIIDTIQEFGRLDILVNNAGIQHVSPIEEFSNEMWDEILAINLSSAFHSIKAALPSMRQQNWGRIINIASVHGLVASAQKSAYVAAKHGLIGLTKTIALETALTNITCNAICPGWVLTPLVQKQIDDMAVRDGVSVAEAKKRLLFEKQPSQEFVTTEQVGGAAVFLCSETAAQIRGLSLNMDGGWLVQ